MADYKEHRWFVLPEYEEEEQYLCDMAKKGYFLEKVTLLGTYHFKKAQPRNMVYRIDFNPQKKEDRESYLQMFEDSGWDYIQDLNEFSYFCKEADGENDEIYSDAQSRIEMLERINRRKMLPILVIFLCAILPKAMQMVLNESFSAPGAVVFYAVWVVVMVLYIYTIARCTAGFQKLRKKYGVQ